GPRGAGRRRFADAAPRRLVPTHPHHAAVLARELERGGGPGGPLGGRVATSRVAARPAPRARSRQRPQVVNRERRPGDRDGVVAHLGGAPAGGGGRRARGPG